MVLADMTGQKIGRWTVLGRGKSDPKRGAYWRCQCECGREKEVLGTNLRAGVSKGCGCHSRAKRAAA